MQEINLEDFFPDAHMYSDEIIVEVPDDVYELLKQFSREEESYRKRICRAKAYYSLEYGDGIEYRAVFETEKIEEMYERKLINRQLYNALSQLPYHQKNRIVKHYYLGQSLVEIAKAEKRDISTIQKSIAFGLAKLSRIIKNL